MSNLSLKDQLQALSLGTVVDESVKEEKKSNITNTINQPNKSHSNKFNKSNETQAAKQKPAWLEHAQYGVELLRAYFPLCFKDTKEIQPLKVGIKADLVKLLSTREDIVIGDKACMVTSLAYYVNSPAYQKAAIEGAVRIDLDGNAAGAVTVEEAKYSAESRQAKLQKKTKKLKS
jgi:hypothetical protein